MKDVLQRAQALHVSLILTCATAIVLALNTSPRSSATPADRALSQVRVLRDSLQGLRQYSQADVDDFYTACGVRDAFAQAWPERFTEDATFAPPGAASSTSALSLTECRAYLLSLADGAVVFDLDADVLETYLRAYWARYAALIGPVAQVVIEPAEDEPSEPRIWVLVSVAQERTRLHVYPNPTKPPIEVALAWRGPERLPLATAVAYARARGLIAETPRGAVALPDLDAVWADVADRTVERAEASLEEIVAAARPSSQPPDTVVIFGVEMSTRLVVLVVPIGLLALLGALSLELRQTRFAGAERVEELRAPALSGASDDRAARLVAYTLVAALPLTAIAFTVVASTLTVRGKAVAAALYAVATLTLSLLTVVEMTAARRRLHLLRQTLRPAADPARRQPDE